MKVSVRPADQAGGGRFFSRDTVTGHDGKFEFAGIPAGKYKIHAVSSSMEGVNPFAHILTIRQTEQEIEVEDALRREVTLSVPTTAPVPGVSPTFPAQGGMAPGAEAAAAAEKMRARTEEEAAALKKKLQEQQRTDEGGGGGGGDGTGDGDGW